MLMFQLLLAIAISLVVPFGQVNRIPSPALIVVAVGIPLAATGETGAGEAGAGETGAGETGVGGATGAVTAFEFSPFSGGVGNAPAGVLPLGEPAGVWLWFAWAAENSLGAAGRELSAISKQFAPESSAMRPLVGPSATPN